MSSLNGECVDFFIWWWVCWFFSPRNERVNFSQCSEGAKFVLPLPVCSCTEEPDPWCSYLPVGMLLGREWKWSVATFAAPQILLKFRFCLQNVSGGGNPNIKKMLYTNHGELFRIFDTFCRLYIYISLYRTMYNGGSSVSVPGRPSWSSRFLLSKMLRKREATACCSDSLWE